MTQWEYCIVSQRAAYFYGTDDVRVTQVLAKRKEDPYHAQARFMAALGCDGWELVSVAASSAFPVDFYLKRPVLV